MRDIDKLWENRRRIKLIIKKKMERVILDARARNAGKIKSEQEEEEFAKKEVAQERGTSKEQKRVNFKKREIKI